MKKIIIAVALTLGAMGSAFAGLIGQSVTTDLQQNGVSFSGPVTAVVGASNPTGNFFGNQIFNYGDYSFSIFSTSSFCGMTCQGQQIELVLSGLNFAGGLSNVQFSTSLIGVQKVVGTNSVKFSWTDQSLQVGTSASPYLSATFTGAQNVPEQNVPEPATLGLMGLGLLGLRFSRRSKS